MNRFLAALSGMLALAVAMGVGRFAFTPLLPEMQRANGLTLAAAGWLASSNYLGYLAGALLAGRWAVSAAKAIRTGLAIVGVTTLAMGFTHDLGPWLALRFAAGVASACVLVFAAAWSLQHLPPSGAATLFSGVGAGIAVAGLACHALFQSGVSPEATWMALGVASLAGAAVLWNSFGDSAGSRVPAGGVSWDGDRVRLVLCYGTFGFGYIIPATFIASMTRSLEATGAGLGGWAWPIFGAAAAASTFVAAALTRRFAVRSVWGASHVVMALGIAAPLVLHSLAGYLACALLVGGTFMVATMTGMQEARRIAGERARPLIGAMTTAFALGQIAGPLVVAAVQSPGAPYDGSLALAAVLLAASAVALYVRPPRKEPP